MIASALLGFSMFASAAAETPTPSNYFIVHFELGPAWDEQLAAHAQVGFKAHAENLQSLRKQGVIVFGARYQDLGVIVLVADDLPSAEQIAKTDPGVQAGIFDYRIAPLKIFFAWQE